MVMVTMMLTRAGGCGYAMMHGMDAFDFDDLVWPRLVGARFIEAHGTCISKTSIQQSLIALFRPVLQSIRWAPSAPKLILPIWAGHQHTVDHLWTDHVRPTWITWCHQF